MDPTLQNVLMLQAIKAGGQQQVQPPMATDQAMGMNPLEQAAMPMPAPQMPPQGGAPMMQTDPASQAGGLSGGGAGMPPGMMQQQNPIAAALMSQIPGVNQ